MRWWLIPWRRVYWSAGLLWSCGCLLAASGAYLIPAPPLLYRSPAYGIVYRGAIPIVRASLTWQGDRWVGRADSFPPGTVTYFSVNSARSFFVVRLADGRVLALSARSSHRGQRVYWYPTLPGRYSGDAAGFMDRDAGTRFEIDGRRVAGPARRDLDPYAATIVGVEIRIADPASCPNPASRWELWCQ
jgi:nitrite reductase/ring-hydroxylating ferredoxin subunit